MPGNFAEAVSFSMEENGTSPEDGRKVLQKEIEKKAERVYNYFILVEVRFMSARTKWQKANRRRSHLGAWGIILIVLAVFGASSVGGIRLRQKNYAYQERENSLMEQIEYLKAILADEKKLLGVTAMTTLLGKKKFEEILGSYITKPQGKPALVPETDKRPAMNTAADDFNEN